MRRFEAVFQVEASTLRARADRPGRPSSALHYRGRRHHGTGPNLLMPRSRSGDGRRQRERAERAHNWASGSITYQYGVTGYTTPAAMALHFQKGVCQDFAHILLALLRLVNVPCRYVSGHMLGEGAPHAWVEALIADPDSPAEVEVIAYDPTHHRRARMD